MYSELASNPGLFPCLGHPSAGITGMCPQAQWKFPLIKVAIVSGHIEGMGKSRTKVDETRQKGVKRILNLTEIGSGGQTAVV